MTINTFDFCGTAVECAREALSFYSRSSADVAYGVVRQSLPKLTMPKVIIKATMIEEVMEKFKRHFTKKFINSLADVNVLNYFEVRVWDYENHREEEKKTVDIGENENHPKPKYFRYERLLGRLVHTKMSIDDLKRETLCEEDKDFLDFVDSEKLLEHDRLDQQELAGGFDDAQYLEKWFDQSSSDHTSSVNNDDIEDSSSVNNDDIEDYRFVDEVYELNQRWKHYALCLERRKVKIEIVSSHQNYLFPTVF
jgi:hypothetical protein